MYGKVHNRYTAFNQMFVYIKISFDGCMNDLQFYVLFNSILIISGRCAGDKKVVYNGISFTVETIPAPDGARTRER